MVGSRVTCLLIKVLCSSPHPPPPLRYLGAKIAFYFAFLGHIIRWLFLASILGCVAFVLQAVGSDPSLVSVAFSGLTILWTAAFLGASVARAVGC